jgi:peroxiredoxin
LRDREPEITAAGAGVALIGTGDVDHAAEFKRRRGAPFQLLVDDDLVTYRMVQAGKGAIGGMVQPSTLAAGVLALARGQMQGRTGRAPLLLGATHVIDPAGVVRFAWRNNAYADNAPIGDVLAAVRS